MVKSLFLLLAVLLAGLGCYPVLASPLRISVVTVEEGGVYGEFVTAFNAAVVKNKLPISLQQNTSLPLSADLIVAVGMKSSLLAMSSGIPTLCVLIPKSGWEKVQKISNTKTPATAIFLDQPAHRQIELISAALPNVRSIGILYSAVSPEITEISRVATEKKLVLHEQQLESSDYLHRNLQTLLQKSDVLLAIPDMQVYNSSTIRNILLETYRGQIPLIGFSPAYVRAGALSAVFSTPEQIATQAADVLSDYIETGRFEPAQYPNDFTVMVNSQVGNSLGIPVKTADELLKQMKLTPKSGGAAR